jgi:pimeloyl-ACP methyl ester carboxylesterase
MTKRPTHLSALAAATVCTAFGAVHALWATAAAAPSLDGRVISRALLGVALPVGPTMPSLVAAVLFAMAAVVWLRARRGGTGRYGWLLQAGTVVVALAFTIRVMAGAVWILGVGLPPGFPAFYWINLAVYTPVCAVAAAAAWTVSRNGRGRPSGLARRSALAVPLLIAATALYGAYGWAPPAQEYRPAQGGEAESRYLDTDLARFHYTQRGHGGPPVVLLSPGSAWTVTWQDQAELLAAEHTVYVVDLPGQGFTELHDPAFAYDLPAMTGALHEFLDSAGLDSVHLGGLSWSAGWALAYAQNHPEHVESLMLLAPSGADLPDSLDWQMLAPPVLGELVANAAAASRDATADSIHAMFANDQQVTPEVVDALWHPTTFPANRESTYLLQRGLDWSTTQEAMSQVQQSTLIIWGEEDTTLPPEYAERFVELMPHTDLHVLEGCGHVLSMDCPSEVGHLMTGFLE